MDNEAVFRDADDLSGFDRTQAWESACEQMNQLGIEEGNLQYKESYCMHIEDLEEQTQRLLKDGSLSAQDAKESWSKDEEGYLFYFSQTLQGIEIFRYENIRDYPGMYGDMQVYVMKDGLGELQIPVLYSCKLEKKKLSLVSFDKIAEVLEKNYGSVITEERSICFKNSCPRPIPSDAPSISPGISAMTNPAPSPKSTTPRIGFKVVK